MEAAAFTCLPFPGVSRRIILQITGDFGTRSCAFKPGETMKLLTKSIIF